MGDASGTGARRNPIVRPETYGKKEGAEEASDDTDALGAPHIIRLIEPLRVVLAAR